MKHFPQHTLDRPHMKRECQIISRIITSALKQGYLVSVFDGEDYALRKSGDRAKIEAECFATDETTLRFTKPGFYGLDAGAVWLVHGNDLDVIADYSDNRETDDILQPAMDWIEAHP